MNYQETIDYLFAQLPMYQRIGPMAYKKDLTNTIALCEALGNPHTKFKTIHVAGTNGKGSTSHLIASMLQEMGMKVGLYTSPHYIDFRERIKINGQLMSESFVIDFVKENKIIFEEIEPSFFEVTVAMAFKYFATEQVDIAVIEVGLGGRLDSTNVITPLLSVITNIGYDHMNMLGHTLTEIATEKAGIIKPHIPVIIGEHGDESDLVFESKARDSNSTLIYASDRIQVHEVESNLEYKLVNIINKDSKIENLKFPLLADYQIKNLKTAICCIDKFQEIENNKNGDSIKNGIEKVYKNTYFIGRWMVMNTTPLVILDSAHNDHGMKEVFAQISKIQYKKLHIIYGTVSDKDLSKVTPILPNATYYFTQADIPRAMNYQTLTDYMNNNGIHGNAYPKIYDAYKDVLTKLDKDDMLLVVGSIFIVGELLNELKRYNYSKF